MIMVSAETERLARRLAERSGKTPEQVVDDAVATEARLVGLAAGEASGRKDIDLERVREIVLRITSKPLRDQRTPSEILDEAWGQTK
jgi:antitoxin VapB